MRKFIGKSNERILCKLSKSEILRLYPIVHVATETTKTSHFTCRSKSFISIFSLANFQLVSCNLSLAMIWQMTYTHKLPKLCSTTLKSEFALPQTYRAYSISFNSSNVGKFFWSWILKDCIKVQEKKKKNVIRLFPSSTKREIRQFHVVVVQRRQRNVQKSVMHVQSCWFACLNLLLFCRTRCRRRRGCVNFLISTPSHLHLGV